jgi:hypothetical protein
MCCRSSKNRQAAGVKGGDNVEVEIALDIEPRTPEIGPKRLAKSMGMSRVGLPR